MTSIIPMASTNQTIGYSDEIKSNLKALRDYIQSCPCNIKLFDLFFIFPEIDTAHCLYKDFHHSHSRHIKMIPDRKKKPTRPTITTACHNGIIISINYQPIIVMFIFVFGSTIFFYMQISFNENDHRSTYQFKRAMNGQVDSYLNYEFPILKLQAERSTRVSPL